MHILVAGPESSGTRMVTVFLQRAGASRVTHSSPAFKKPLDRWTSAKYNPGAYDAVVMVVRNGIWNERSMENRHRFRSDKYDSPREQIAVDLYEILMAFAGLRPVHVVTYESLVYETEHCLRTLAESFGLPVPAIFDDVQNGNEKFWSDNAWPGDDRTLEERW